MGSGRTYRPLTEIVLDRLRRGPARPCELTDEMGVSPDDASRLLRHLEKKGRVQRTRLIFKGRWGGNVGAIYQLVC